MQQLIAGVHLCLISLFLCTTALAGEKIELHGNDTALVAKLNSRGIHKESSSAAVQGLGGGKSYLHSFRGEALDLGPDHSFHAFKETSDRSRSKHTRYRQLYKNIPIFAKELILHEDQSGRIQNLNGSIVKGIEQDLDPNVPLSPAFSASEALERVKELFVYNAKRKIQPSPSAPVKEKVGPAQGDVAYRNEQSELNIYVDENNKPQLVYYVNFYTEPHEGGEPSRPHLLIDAKTGQVVKRWDGLTHQAIGTGPGGNAKVGQYEYGTGYGYLDVLQNGSLCSMQTGTVTTVDMTGQPDSYVTAFSYNCPRNTTKSINGAYSPLNDAHYFGNVIVNMYTTWYGAPPIPLPLVMRPHYGTNYENAFWDGQYMTFGDGYSTFYPLVSLDVAAHEISHGFTEFNSNLIYEKESGGINESFSDMAGEAAKYFMRGSNDWRVGYDIVKSSGALRYMDNPPADYRSIADYSQYTDSLDVHYSSGLFNKAFYLLATKPGWNTRKAFDVMVKANKDYWVAASTFRSAACGAISAATDLGYNSTDVDSAFMGVNVYCRAPDIAVSVIPPAAIHGMNTLTNVSQPFSQAFTASGNATPFTWSKFGGTLPPGITLNGTTGEISGTPTAIGSYNFKLQVVDSLGRKNFIEWTIVVGSGLRPGWPKVLALRADGPSSYSPVFTDLNGDGKDEIVAVDANTLYLLNETGVYKKIVLPGDLSAPAVADLDNDGQMEIVVTVKGPTKPIYAFHADLTPVQGFPAGGYNNYVFLMGSPVIADLDADGTKQIVAVGFPSSSTYPDQGREIIQMVDHQGRVVTGWPKPMAVDPNFTWSDKTVAIGDMDSDGKNEMVFASSDGKVHIFRKNGSEFAQWPIAATVASSESPVLADANGDGIPEVVLSYQIDNQSYGVNICDRNGVPLPGWPWIKAGGRETPPVVADLDDDGQPEIVMGTGDNVSGIGTVNYLTVLRADGSIQPGWPVTIERFYGIDSYPIIGDINGDGYLEILVTTMTAANSCGFGFCSTWDSALTAYTYDGHPVRGYPQNIPNNVELRSAPAIGDVDNNGKVDVVIKSEDGMIYLWEASSASPSRFGDWPMYLHDSQHSGAFPMLFTVAPAQHDFGAIVVGSSSLPLAVTITNREPAPITVTALGITGIDNTMFAISPGTCGTLPVVLAHGSSCTATVTFSPTSAGTTNAALAITSISKRGMVVVPLSGEGLLNVQHTLTLTTGGGGTGSVTLAPGGTTCSNNCSKNFTTGTVVTLTAIPDAASVFVGWSGACSGTGSCTVTMDTDNQVVAQFGLSSSFESVVLAAGAYHTVLVKNGLVWAWGYNSSGQLGDGTTTNRLTPVQVPGISGVTAIAAGFHTVVAKADGSVWAWGQNSSGQLGDGTTTSRSVPGQVPGFTGITAIAAGQSHTVALKSDGTVWSWGYNGSGQLGDGTKIMRTNPVKVQGLTNVIAIAAGQSHTVALKSDGTVWSWGDNYLGQLGDGTTVNRLTPVQVPGLISITAIAAGERHTEVMGSDGSLWGWGYNIYGQVGDGTKTNRLIPTQVQGSTGVGTVRCGSNHSIALKGDKTLSVWGFNFQGQLGDRTNADRPSPVQVADLSNVFRIAAGGYHTVAATLDGTIWTWGYNNNGQLGDGTTTNRNVPTMVQAFSLFPVATITGAPVTSTNSTNATLTVGGPDIVAYKYKVDTGGFSAEIAVDTPIILSSLSEGVHSVSVVGKDAAGTWQATATVTSWTVDVTPPTATVTGTPASPTSSTSATFTVGGTGVVSYRFQLDTGTFSAETAVITPIILTGLSEGTHSVSIVGKDAAGNWQVTSTTVSWTVDVTPPTATISGTPASPSNSTSATLTVSGTGVISYKYKLDAGNYSTEIVVANPISLTALSEATHTVSVIGKDSAGNWQGTPTTVNWAVDLPPVATISGTPVSPTTSTSATLTIGGIDIVAYKYKLDSDSYSAETAAAKQISFTGLAEATHTVSVLGKDAAGNWQVTPTTATWTVNLPPVTTLTTNPVAPNGVNGWFVTTPTISLTSSKPGVTYYRVGDGPTTGFSYSTQPQSWVVGGAAVNVRGDDTGTWCNLPFPFSFYGTAYTKVYVSSNGLLRFDIVDNSYSNSATNLKTKIAIAALWDDLTTIARTGDDLYVFQPDQDTVVFRWQAVTLSTSYDTNFEAILYRDGRIRFNYGAQAGGLTPTIGISKGDGATFHVAYDNNLTTTNNMASILYTPTSSWSTYTGALTPAAGDTILNYYSVDALGATEAAQSQHMKVDTVAPVSSASVAGGVYNAGISVTLSCGDTGGSGCAAAWYCLGAGCTPTTLYSSAITIAASTDLRFYSKDTAGNSETVKTVTYTIDTLPPVTTATPGGGIYASSPSVTLSCSDTGGGVCLLTYYCLGTGCTPITPYSSAITINTSTDLRFYSTDLAGNSEAVQTAAYTILAADYAVNLTVDGTGAGSVVSTPSGLACNGNCSARFAGGSIVTLQASAFPYSVFAGWSGACNGTGDCFLPMTGDRSVTATFSKDVTRQVKVDEGLFFSRIQDAYDGAGAATTMRLWAVDFVEDLIFDKEKDILLRGGYDEQYSTNDGLTTVHGKLDITGGSVTIEGLQIAP